MMHKIYDIAGGLAILILIIEALAVFCGYLICRILKDTHQDRD